MRFRNLSNEEIGNYLASGEWKGKAGGYAIQGIAGAFVVKMVGSYTNVVGLPLTEVVNLLKAKASPSAISGSPRPRRSRPSERAKTRGNGGSIAGKAKAARKAPRCPICGKPATLEFRPFCSRRCTDIDLGRWLGGRYAVPGEPIGRATAQEDPTKTNDAC